MLTLPALEAAPDIISELAARNGTQGSRTMKNQALSGPLCPPSNPGSSCCAHQAEQCSRGESMYDSSMTQGGVGGRFASSINVYLYKVHTCDEFVKAAAFTGSRVFI